LANREYGRPPIISEQQWPSPPPPRLQISVQLNEQLVNFEKPSLLIFNNLSFPLRRGNITEGHATSSSRHHEMIGGHSSWWLDCFGFSENRPLNLRFRAARTKLTACLFTLQYVQVPIRSPPPWACLRCITSSVSSKVPLYGTDLHPLTRTTTLKLRSLTAHVSQVFSPLTKRTITELAVVHGSI
jgi:hypothetical protein